jgi:uncharacterized OB-fold protein
MARLVQRDLGAIVNTPTAYLDPQDYWRYAAESELRLPKCGECGEWAWYPRHRCGRCHSVVTAWVPVDPVGTLFTWTRIHYPYLPELKSFLPITIGLIQLRAGPRVIGWLRKVDKIEIGMAMRGRFEAFEGLDRPRLVFMQSTVTEG